MNFKKHFLTLAALACCAGMQAADHTFTLNASKAGAPIQKTMYGIFYEDINFAGDGGLYAEMVKNRSFEFPNRLQGWKTFGQVEVREDGPFERNPHYVRLRWSGHDDKYTGIENEGFFGISIEKGKQYRISFWARTPEGGASSIRVAVDDVASMGESQTIVKSDIKVDSKDWKKYQAVFTAPRSFDGAVLRLVLMAGEKGAPRNVTTDLEHVSLFPVDTWKGRENGVRKDLAQLLADLKPGVFRFPGGCIVEGTDLETRFQWKNSVGPVENRPLNENRWRDTFLQRLFPDYYQSYGLGFYEFFLLCEDFGCEPLPVISVGLSCQFQNRDPKKPGVHVPVDELDSYIQDALDLVEFANGDPSTTWGKVRAEMGHPEPFNLHYLGVGNEQWDYKDNAAFTDRLRKFNAALRAKYPDLKLIGTTGPDSEGEKFNMLQPKMKELKVDLYDEHFYRNEEWFLGTADKNKYPTCGALRYDKYDRKGPKVFAGEYACHGKGKKWNHFETSLYEAAFMTGFERNADIVHMCTYAPLFAHVKGWQWRPDMIWYDNTRAFRTVSYYVQQLYSTYKGSNVLSLTMDKKPVAGQPGQDGLFASAVLDKGMNAVVVKIANVSDQEQTVNIKWQGKKDDYKFSSAYAEVLHCDEMDAENSLENPKKIEPKMIEVKPGEPIRIGAKTFGVYVFQRYEEVPTE